MLNAFGFGRVGVVVADIYFRDPRPLPGQESAERGIRLEVRLLEAGEVEGSIYASRPITIGTPVWRADLLESVDSPYGTFDRTHHHPSFNGWEPGERKFEPLMSADPVGFVGERLSDLKGLLTEAGISADNVAPDDAAELAAAIPEIQHAMRRMLARVHRGELALAPTGTHDAALVRESWL